MQLANSSTPASPTLRLRDICRLTVLPLPVVRETPVASGCVHRQLIGSRRRCFAGWGSCKCSSGSRARTQMLTCLRTAVSVATFVVVVAVPILIRADTHNAHNIELKNASWKWEKCVCLCVVSSLCWFNRGQWGVHGGRGGSVRWLWPVGYASYCVRLCSIMCLICHNRSFRKLNWPQNRC